MSSPQASRWTFHGIGVGPSTLRWLRWQAINTGGGRIEDVCKLSLYLSLTLVHFVTFLSHLLPSLKCLLVLSWRLWKHQTVYCLQEFIFSFYTVNKEEQEVRKTSNYSWLFFLSLSSQSRRSSGNWRRRGHGRKRQPTKWHLHSVTIQISPSVHPTRLLALRRFGFVCVCVCVWKCVCVMNGHCPLVKRNYTLISDW